MKRLSLLASAVIAFMCLGALPLPARSLYDAASDGNVVEVVLLIKNGADVNAKDDLGGSALIKAAENGHTEIAKLLINNGANVNAKDKVDIKELIREIEADLKNF